MATIGVCYLVRKAHGPQVVANFLKSYAECVAGVEHDLVLIFKGFPDGHIPPEYAALLDSVRYISLFVPDRNFDLGAYFAASALLEHDYLCFFNSYSVILCQNWLAKLYNYIVNPDIGVVGATASYQSHYTHYLYFLEQEVIRAQPSRYLWRRVGGRIIRKILRRNYKRLYDPFPNYHIRTNGFIISRKLMLSLKRRPFRNKNVALMFESGKQGLSKQIYALGLEVLIVGCDGKAYTKDQWNQSRIFYADNQENLLVSDNKTQEYVIADEVEKQRLSHIAWKGH